MRFELKDKLYLAGLKPETRSAIREMLTMDNPKYQDAQKMSRYTKNIDRELKFYEETRTGLTCPRGAVAAIYNLCRSHDETIEVIDSRLSLDPVSFDFHGDLRPLQVPAVESCLSKSFGLLESPTGSGKTAMALYMITQRKQPALIVVHTKELLIQWINRIEQFLQIPREEIGIIGAGQFKIGNGITVAMVQTLCKVTDQVAPFIGYLVLDECHRAPAMQYVKAVETFDCKYMTGLTATPWRRDGLSKVIFWHIGSVTGQIDKQDLLDNGNLCPAEVRWIKTRFNTSIDVSQHYSKALSELTGDYDRNQLVCDTVAAHNGHGVSLILSDRKEHCQTIQNILLRENHIKAEVLTGATSLKEREQIIQELQQGKCKYLIATGQLIGEGFDLPEISTIFLTTPIKFSGRVIQYIGRALRPAPGKNNAVIFDFADVLNPVFKASAMSRFYTYNSQGITEKVSTRCQTRSQPCPE